MALKLDKTKLVRNLVSNYKFVPFLDKAIVDAGEFEWKFTHEPKIHDDGWHPSSDCTPTLQELYLQATVPGEPEVFPASLRKTFMVGHFWHQYLQWVTVEKLGFCGWERVERHATRTWAEGAYGFVSGSGDLAPVDLPGAGPHLVDFKTMNAYDFKQNSVPERWAAKYECQINIYMELFQLNQALIVSVCKDSPHDMKEFRYEKNQELVDAILLKWKIVTECLKAGIEPPPDEDVHLPLTGMAA